MTKRGFTIVPNQIIWDDDLCNDSKQLFTYIRSLSEKYRTLRNSTLKAKLNIVKYSPVMIHWDVENLDIVMSIE